MLHHLQYRLLVFAVPIHAGDGTKDVMRHDLNVLENHLAVRVGERVVGEHHRRTIIVVVTRGAHTRWLENYMSKHLY